MTIDRISNWLKENWPKIKFIGITLIIFDAAFGILIWSGNLKFDNPVVSNVILSVLTVVLSEVYYQVTRELNSKIKSLEEKIAKGALTGFYEFLSNKDAKKAIQSYKEMIEEAQEKTQIRELLLDFAVRSLSNFGRNGLAIVDANVKDYVDYIRKILPERGACVMVCNVRPFWFATDYIRGVSLSPVGNGSQPGKAEHLAINFNSGSRSTGHQRWITINEKILAEVLLTSFVDRRIKQAQCEDCHICKGSRISCPYHNLSKENELIACPSNECKNHIPEIFFFEKLLHGDYSKVDLYYTVVSEAFQESFDILTDRICVTNPYQLNISFEFNNLENGTLRVDWSNGDTEHGKNLDSLKPLKTAYNSPADITTGERARHSSEVPPQKQHTFYVSFENALKSSTDPKAHSPRPSFYKSIDKYLKVYKFQVESNFNKEIYDNIYDSQFIMPESQHNTLKSLLISSIASLRDVLSKYRNDGLTLDEFYRDILCDTYYNGEEVLFPKIGYYITYDSKHNNYPVRPVRWFDHFEEIKNMN